MLELLLVAVSLLVLYFIIRKGVLHGILDADDARRVREQEEQSEKAFRSGQFPDAPKPL